MPNAWRIQKPGPCAAAVLLLFLQLMPESLAHAAPKQVSIELDKTSPAAKAALANDKLGDLKGSDVICLDLKVRANSSPANGLRRSTEEDATTRDTVLCGPSDTGSFAMGHGIEYYTPTQDEAGNRVDLSVYPGSRTAHTANDVACEFDADGKSAWFRVRGLYQSITSRFADVDAGGKPTGKAILAIQLRPVDASREDLAGCRP